MTSASADLRADWLTIVQSEMRALAEDREVREAQAAALDQLIHDGRDRPDATVPRPDAPAGAATAGDAPGARDGKPGDAGAAAVNGDGGSGLPAHE